MHQKLGMLGPGSHPRGLGPPWPRAHQSIRSLACWALGPTLGASHADALAAPPQLPDAAANADADASA